MRAHVSEHTAEMDYDYLHAMLSRNEASLDPTSSDYENLRYAVRDLIIAGTETTATSVRWIVVMDDIVGNRWKKRRR